MVEELQSLFQEMEAIVAEAAKGNGGGGVGTVVDRLQKQVEQARQRVTDFEKAVEHRVRHAASTTEQSIRRNPWESIAITAAVAFALGVILSRRD